MSEAEIIKYFKEIISWHREYAPDKIYALNNKDIEMIQGLLDLYQTEKIGNENLQMLLDEEKERYKNIGKKKQSIIIDFFKGVKYLMN